MFPSVLKEDGLKERIKEKQWDDRLGSKGGIPDYSPLRDKHTKSYRRLISSSKKDKEKDEENKGKATYFQRRMELFDQLTALHKPHTALLEEYEQLAGKYRLPNFYIYYTLLPLLSPAANPQQYLFNEKKQLKEQSSHYHRISTAVRAREECLERLRKTLGEATEDKLEGVRDTLREEVEHLRFLNENVVDEVKRWRDSLGRIDERAVYYSDGQENYLVKMLNDNKFIFSSKLAGALSFAEKNDPFLLVPLKRAEGKEASMFAPIVQLTKDVSHYQRYMEYLASEKAYELAANAQPKPKEGYKNPAVQRVYKAGGQRTEAKEGREQEEDGVKKMELLKMREERLKKNEERIKSIKGIYETYARKVEEKQYRSEKKVPQTDIEDRKGSLKKRSESIKVLKLDRTEKQTDSEFDSMVKAKMHSDRLGKARQERVVESKSSSKLPKTEDKMIESLRDIQSTLRSKLQVIQQEDKHDTSIMSLTQQKFAKRNNEDIIKELKAEIMGKIEKQASEKDKAKKKRREQEEKALQEVKTKLKKEMEEKLQQKKREKLVEREELEKKLKEEEERLNNQRQLELQLQLKLNKEKELRELEKIRREALEREKRYKEELEKEQTLRKEKEEAVQVERREKEKLIEQLKKRELKQQIEEELRHQIKQRNNNDSRGSDLLQTEQLRSQKQAELSKEIEQLKLKEGVEMEQLRKENELRTRMLQLRKDEEQLKRKEIEQLMRQAVQQEKEELERDSVKKRIQLEEHMRSNVKEKLLEEYRNEKEAALSKTKQERESQLEEEVYREKIREKIEKDMRMEAIARTKRELEDRQSRKYDSRSKLEQVKGQFDKQVTLDKGKIEQQVKKEMIEKVIFDKQAEKEAAKHDLRAQFEKELMASAIPQIYDSKESFMLKNTSHLEGDLHLNSKLHQQRPTNQKPNVSTESPSKVRPLIDSMTLQQLKVYEKQKEKVSETKEQKFISPMKIPQEEEGFQLLRVEKSKREEEGFDVKVVKQDKQERRGQKEREKVKQKEKEKKKKKRRESSESDSQDDRKKKKRKNRKHYYEEEQSDSEEVDKKRKKRQKRRKQSSEEQPSSELSVSPPKKSKKSNVPPQQTETEKSKLRPTPTKQATREKSEKAVVYFDAEKEKQLPFNPIDQITIKPQKVNIASQKFKMSLQAIPQAEFDEYLQVHLSRVPPIQLAIMLNSREQLFRKLIGQLTFCLLVGQWEGRVVGLALAYHDRTRADSRKFTLVHAATYKNEDLRDFLLSVSNFIFRKDPADQIEFHYRFDENTPSQLQFSTDFNRWFDRVGSVFQKRVQQGIFERKYVLKRQFNQKCQVVLGGVNKNNFRNLFSVYCGVLMSDTDMLQFKEELVDTLAPENQVCYSIMVSELFRTYLSPDEAETLKQKVKEFVKLKEMLILVVMMQKKKLKLDQLKLYEYKNLIELNMRLMSQGKDIVRYCKDTNADLNRIFYAELSHGFNLPFHFQTTSLPVQSHEQAQLRQISYFRLSPLPPFKLHIIKSSLYNAEMNILPTENSKYKLFVLPAQEYNEIKESNHIDLFMYVRLFLKNVKSHNVAVWKYVWLPEMTDKAAWNLREYRSFLNKDFYCHDSVNLSYRQFLPGALIIEPEHRDLVVTPPFIIGVMSMSLEQVSEGSPLYARMIEIDALKTLEVEK